MTKFFLYPCNTLSDEQFATRRERERSMATCWNIAAPYTTKSSFDEMNDGIGRLTLDLRGAEDIENICTEFQHRTGRMLRWSEWYI